MTFGDRLVGRVRAERQGLYYLFRCRCRLSGEAAFRLLVSCGEKQEDLGILVPMEGGFGLDTRRPVKRLGEERCPSAWRPITTPRKPISRPSPPKSPSPICKGSRTPTWPKKTASRERHGRNKERLYTSAKASRWKK